MNPKTKSTLLDIVAGILSFVAIFTLLSLFSFSVGFMVIAAVPVIAGYLRGKDPGEFIPVKVLLMNLLFFLLLAAVMNGVFHLLLVVVVGLTGTALGIYIRRRYPVSKMKVWVYSLAFFLPVVIVGVFVLPSYFDWLMWAENTQVVPEYKFISGNGDTIRSTDYAGKVVVINFWATWCGPCRKELPVIEKICKRYKDNTEVVFLVVNPMGRDTPKEVEDFLDKNKYELPFVMDDKNKWSRSFNVRAMPTTLIVDKGGVIRMTHSGFEESEHLDEILSEHINRLIGRDR